MDRNTANKIAANLTRLLNEKIDTANQDSRLRKNRTESDWYRPIGRTIFPSQYDRWDVPCPDMFDDFRHYMYEWNAVFEFGNSKSSSCFSINFFPLPLEYIKQFNSDYKKEIKNKWQQLNPVINLSKEIFS